MICRFSYLYHNRILSFISPEHRSYPSSAARGHIHRLAPRISVGKLGCSGVQVQVGWRITLSVVTPKRCFSGWCLAHGQAHPLVIWWQTALYSSFALALFVVASSCSLPKFICQNVKFELTGKVLLASDMSERSACLSTFFLKVFEDVHISWTFIPAF